MLQKLAFGLLYTLLLSGCGGSSSSSDSTRDDQDKLNRLGPGSHAGFIVGFEQPQADLVPLIDGYMAAAQASGVDIGRVHLDWTGLEPNPENYDDSDIREQMEELNRWGLLPMATVSTLDSLELTFPPDLMEDDQAMANGLMYDDPIVIDRMKKLLDWLAPLLIENGVWLLSLANEPNIRLSEHTEERESFVNFIREATHYLHSIQPEIPVTVTLSGGAINETPELVEALHQFLDVATFNIYCNSYAGVAGMQESVSGMFDELDDNANGLPMVIQEFGCESGYTDKPSQTGTSPEIQAAFYAAVLDETRKRENLRAVFSFQLLDWSPALTQSLLDSFPDQSPEFLEPQREIYTTIGMVSWLDGASRPAWNAFLEGANRLLETR
jgi:hypothetical protein